jgi:hypothetical protein
MGGKIAMAGGDGSGKTERPREKTGFNGVGFFPA